MRMSIVRLVAASLVSALLAGPVLLDACMFTCHGSSDSAADPSEPSCHHVSDDADVRVQAPPTPCGHDHSPTPSTLTAQQRDADGRCDLGFGVWDSPHVQDSTKPVSRIENRIVSDSYSCRGASPPLRV